VSHCASSSHVIREFSVLVREGLDPWNSALIRSHGAPTGILAVLLVSFYYQEFRDKP